MSYVLLDAAAAAGVKIAMLNVELQVFCHLSLWIIVHFCTWWKLMTVYYHFYSPLSYDVCCLYDMWMEEKQNARNGWQCIFTAYDKCINTLHILLLNECTHHYDKYMYIHIHIYIRRADTWEQCHFAFYLGLRVCLCDWNTKRCSILSLFRTKYIIKHKCINTFVKQCLLLFNF